ncbi:MAG: NEW3 domain-containing protein, partial [Candidatus Caldarchaeum sp.]
MRQKTLLVIVSVLAAALNPFVAQALAVQVVDVVWGSPENPERAIPGDENIQLSMVIANVGNKPVCTLEAVIIPKYGSDLPIESWDGSGTLNAFHTGQLQPGTMATLVFHVNVASGYQPGTYEADAKITYRECSSTSDLLPRGQLTTTISLRIFQPPALRLVRSAWIVDGVERPVGPGTGLAVLRLFLEAPSKTSVRSVEAQLTLPSSLAHPSGENRLSDTYLDTVPAGGFFTLDFPLVIPSDVRLGTHEFELELRFKNKYGTTVTQEMSFTAEVTGREEVEVSARPQNLRRGAGADLSLTVENTGTAPAHNVEMEVRSDSPKIQVLLTKTTLGVINPGQELEVKVPLYVDRTAEAGIYSVTSLLNYQDGLGNRWSKSFKTSFTVSEEFRAGVKVSASQAFVQAAATTPLTINVTNTNPFTITEVKITLSSSGSFLTIVEGATTASLSRMLSNAVHSMPVKVLATPQAGDSIGILRAQVEYKDEAGERWVESVDIPLAVRADIEIRFKGVQLSPLKVSPGETVDVAGDIVNEGANVARAVSAEVVGEPPFEAMGESRAFVGAVNPSQVSAFTLNFR